MSHSIKITSIKPDTHLESGERFLDVEAQILDEAGEVVDTKRLAYPIDTTERQIRDDLAVILDTYVKEVEHNNSAEAQKENEVEQQNKHADTLVQNLVGEEIK